MCSISKRHHPIMSGHCIGQSKCFGVQVHFSKTFTFQQASFFLLMSCFAFHLNSRTSAYCIILDAERFYQVFCSFAHRIVKKVLAQARYKVFIVNYHQPKIQNCINAYNYRVISMKIQKRLILGLLDVFIYKQILLVDVRIKPVFAVSVSNVRQSTLHGNGHIQERVRQQSYDFCVFYGIFYYFLYFLERCCNIFAKLYILK